MTIIRTGVKENIFGSRWFVIQKKVWYGYKTIHETSSDSKHSSVLKQFIESGCIIINY